MRLKNMLGEIKTDCGRMHCGWLPSELLSATFWHIDAVEWVSSTRSSIDDNFTQLISKSIWPPFPLHRNR
jgi:hypothetical protein